MPENRSGKVEFRGVKTESEMPVHARYVKKLRSLVRKNVPNGIMV